MIELRLGDAEHQLLRNILNDVMRQEGTGGDEYEETLNALHEKICVYWMEEETSALEETASFWGEALKAGLTD